MSGWMLRLMLLAVTAFVLTPTSAFVCLAQGRAEASQAKSARVLLTVVDKNRNSVSTLKAEDIRVVSEGAAQEVLSLERQTGTALRLVLMMDASASQEQVLPVARGVALSFVDAVLRPQTDEAAVVSFTGEMTVEQNLTSEVERVRQAIGRVRFVAPPGWKRGGIIVGGQNLPSAPPVGASTALWDALWKVSDEVLSKAPPDARRAIILLTDGSDTSSRIKRDDAIRKLIESGVVVYAVGLGDKTFPYDGVYKDTLTRLAERTGGRAFFPEKSAELDSIFARIRQELREQYVVTFRSKDGKGGDSYRKVKIELVNPELRRQDLSLAYPQGYFVRP
jgi:Ca-activated chloride channel family protein